MKLAIMNGLPAEEVLLWDDSDGCGAKFKAVIVASKFQGMKLLDRNRAVNSTFESLRPRIHAFSMRTWTPEEYETKKASGQPFF
uniref:BolA-like protein n=1 Tax=Arcella intermedia TaxID=1963864 RepID=A0A6B2LW69_9EUKA